MWVNVVGQTRRKDVVTPTYKLTIALEMKLSSMIFQTDENQNERYVRLPLIFINIE